MRKYQDMQRWHHMALKYGARSLLDADI